MAEPATTSVGIGIILKGIGAMIGSGLALTVLAPEHHRDAAVRAVVGVVFGFVFAHPAYHLISPLIGDAGPDWNLMTGATVAGFTAWSVVSVAATTLKSWKSLGDIRNSFKPTPARKRRRRRRNKALNTNP